MRGGGGRARTRRGSRIVLAVVPSLPRTLYRVLLLAVIPAWGALAERGTRLLLDPHRVGSTKIRAPRVPHPLTLLQEEEVWLLEVMLRPPVSDPCHHFTCQLQDNRRNCFQCPPAVPNPPGWGWGIPFSSLPCQHPVLLWAGFFSNITPPSDQWDTRRWWPRPSKFLSLSSLTS